MNKYAELFQEVKKESKTLLSLSDDKIKKILHDLAELTASQAAFLLAENKKDLDRMESSHPMYDRLLLTEARIQSICQEIRQVADLPNPLQRVLEQKTLENGLVLRKVSVPLGVIGVIYEARPNVTMDVFALALKSCNGLVLKGGSDASFSNSALITLIHRILKKHDVSTNAFQLLSPERESTAALLQAVGWVDVIIPRGSQGLIQYVRENAKVPVIETGAGIVHVYVDQSADPEIAKSIILNAKTRRPSVCNALDCLIVHESQLENLPDLLVPLLEKHVEIFADEKAIQALPEHPLIQKASEEHFGTEFLGLKLSIKVVRNLDEALAHIDQYSSKHSECIIARDQEAIEHFQLHVDAAVVYANASTAFTDGAQFGLGAEIGISTQKLHARGPMALAELCSYKWVVTGSGQIREG
ncbi:glutamate-5-semialdehyde dehydrogenase [Algoriphagus namhaensis]